MVQIENMKSKQVRIDSHSNVVYNVYILQRKCDTAVKCCKNNILFLVAPNNW